MAPTTSPTTDLIFSRVPPIPIDHSPRKAAAATASKGLTRAIAPSARPPSQAQAERSVLLAQATPRAATRAQVRVNMWVIKLMPTKRYQGDAASSRIDIRAVRRE